MKYITYVKKGNDKFVLLLVATALVLGGFFVAQQVAKAQEAKPDLVITDATYKVEDTIVSGQNVRSLSFLVTFKNQGSQSTGVGFYLSATTAGTTDYSGGFKTAKFVEALSAGESRSEWLGGSYLTQRTDSFALPVTFGVDQTYPDTNDPSFYGVTNNLILETNENNNYLTKTVEINDTQTKCPRITVETSMYHLEPCSLIVEMVDGEGDKPFQITIVQEGAQRLYGYSVYGYGNGFPTYAIIGSSSGGVQGGKWTLNEDFKDNVLNSENGQAKVYSGYLPIWIYHGSWNGVYEELKFDINLTVRPASTPTTTADLIVTDIQPVAVTAAGATIKWIVNQISSGKVVYSTTENVDTTQQGVTGVLQSSSGEYRYHAVLSGLKPRTTYYYKIVVDDPTTSGGTKVFEGGYSYLRRFGTLSEAADYNPRIQYWYGKVNQHVENGVWKTDPDGVSGANLDKLTYCKKWYPATTRIEDYRYETIFDYKAAGNSGSYIGTHLTTRCIDETPRIAYWYGKVNQHVENGVWKTDSDGVSGADLDKLTYCKKFYPQTTSVAEYIKETIFDWKERGNVNSHVKDAVSYRCVGTSNVAPIPDVSIKALTSRVSEIASEGGSAGTVSKAFFEISRTGEVSKELSGIGISLTGSAKPGADYTTNIGGSQEFFHVTIPVGSATTTLSVEVIDDKEVEGDEQLVATLYSGYRWRYWTDNVAWKAEMMIEDNDGSDVLGTVRDISHSFLTPTSARIIWGTDRAYSCSVVYKNSPGVSDDTIESGSGKTIVFAGSDNRATLENLKAGQTYYYKIVCRDLVSNNKVAESAEKFFKVSFDLPDFVVRGIAAVKNAADGYYYAAVDIENIGGTAEAKSLDIEVIDLDTNQTYQQSLRGSGFERGFKYRMEMSSSLFPKDSGRYRLQAIVDPFQVFVESNESNNSLTKTVELASGNITGGGHTVGGRMAKIQWRTDGRYNCSVVFKGHSDISDDLLFPGAGMSIAYAGEQTSLDVDLGALQLPNRENERVVYYKIVCRDRADGHKVAESDVQKIELPAASAARPPVSSTVTPIENDPDAGGNEEVRSLRERIKRLELRISDLEKQVVERERQLTARINEVLTKRVAGNILLQVQGNGEAWYVDPITEQRFYLRDGQGAYQALQAFGLGIKTFDLSKIPIGIEKRFQDVDSDGDGLFDKLEESLGTNPNDRDSDKDGFSDGEEIHNGYDPRGNGRLIYDSKLSQRLNGRILIDVDGMGRAWYVKGGKRYYLKDGDSAYQIMRFLSLGITNENLRKIAVGEFE